MKTTGNKYTMLNFGLLHIQLSVTPISQKAPIIWFIQMKTLRPQTSRGATVLTISPRGSPIGSSMLGRHWNPLVVGSSASWLGHKGISPWRWVWVCGIKIRESPAFLFFGFLPHHVFPLTWAFHMMPTAMMQCSQRCPLQGWHGVF